MSEKYKFRDQDGMYFVTTTVVGWVDLFTRPELKHIVIESLEYAQKNKGLIIHAWCLMPSHLHMIVSTKGESLHAIMRDFKRKSAQEIISTIDRIQESRKGWMMELFADVAAHLKRIKHYKIWQDGNHPILLSETRMIDQRLEYIHQNPVESEIVDEPEEYRYSSARDYFTRKKGYLEVSIIA